MRLIIAGGGTGGHLFPAMAIARALKAEDSTASVLFVGTKNGIEARTIPGTEFPIRFITARGMMKTGIFNSALSALEIPVGLFQSVSIIRRFRPDCVLGVGGYASGPTVLAAWMMRVPTAIQEQNSVMGTTNRILSRLVDRIFISWENTEPATPPKKTIVEGNPVRDDIFSETSKSASNPGEFRILIFGGSRGARSINQSVIANLDALSQSADKVRILHQTGIGAAQELMAAYKKAGIEAEVREFIHDMGSAYQWANVVICRSGASSLAEITALGKPAIVIPYPYAIGDHQARNAAVLQARGAVRVVNDSNLKNGALLKEIRTLMDRPELLSEMAENSRKLGRPQAATEIAKELLKLERSGK
ncbi:MAG: undecaprenyldiphospho-muramoylpentapeptide beta-N-acetylglucosaminyltransferase [Desulfomonile tiedjei]|uniref:UDP-N-acetylglucosamine--N-acetylmuramyl-(pentapeptide) pyrophosphoryl-undecaprenol N-acetylglucosamine transferase n=1 Tax=Desulfomonile tiedjei TaxID=2358 RepID=A0A9D6Z638_9BACT|nr:undecaprenyldiphospho-muramoylpentapeptide beta-N-acetylglucosaminyltransferase [Desulfomonile tiedjei]